MRFEQAGRTITIPDTHAVYAPDVMRYFDVYADAHVDGTALDFTKPADFMLHDWPWPVRLPSFTEPVSALHQYLEHAQLRPGGTAIDAGGYAGLTSMLLADVVGSDGTVVCLEPDPVNHACAEVNFARYLMENGHAPILLKCALSDRDGEASFSSESAMGSALMDDPRGVAVTVQTMTVGSVLALLRRDSVDYIKLDIEGAELTVLRDDFFATHHPRLSVEIHRDLDAIRQRLVDCGYTVSEEAQIGSPFPLIRAT